MNISINDLPFNDNLINYNNLKPSRKRNISELGDSNKENIADRIVPLQKKIKVEKANPLKELKNTKAEDLEAEAPFSSEMESDEGTAPKYDYELYLSLIFDGTEKGLRKKAEKKGMAGRLGSIDLCNPNPEMTPLEKLTHNSRIYVIGHSGAGYSQILSDKDPKAATVTISVKELVSMIAKNAPHLVKEDDGGARIKISLVACYGGSANVNGFDSFAVQLSKALDKAGIPADVVGRTARVNKTKPVLADNPNFRYRKLVEWRHKKMNDTVVVNTKKGKTTISIVEEDRTIKQLGDKEIGEWKSSGRFMGVVSQEFIAKSLKNNPTGFWMVSQAPDNSEKIILSIKLDKDRIEHISIKDRGLTIAQAKAIYKIISKATGEAIPREGSNWEFF